MMPIAVFYHCLFFKDTGEPFDRALPIVAEQVFQMEQSGLVEAVSHFVIGINGGEESVVLSNLVLPKKAIKVYHGLASKAENLTIMLIEQWVKTHPGWLVLYFHAKGSTHPEGSPYGINVSDPWRRAMMFDLVESWRECVNNLEHSEVVCSHFLRGMGWDKSQNLAAGNFWWAQSSFLATLPSMMLRERIKTSGIAALESRYESEVWIGNGRMPTVMEYRPNGGGGVP